MNNRIFRIHTISKDFDTFVVNEMTVGGLLSLIAAKEYLILPTVDGLKSVIMANSVTGITPLTPGFSNEDADSLIGDATNQMATDETIQ